MVFNCNHDRLVHLIAYDFSNTCFSQISFHDSYLLSQAEILLMPDLRVLLRDNSLDTGDVSANLFDSCRIVQLVGCILESQVEKFLLSSY